MSKALQDILNDRANRKAPGLMDRIIGAVYSVRWWIGRRLHDNRTIKVVSLAPGYHDKDELLFHGAFDLLVRFVEVELAWMEGACCNSANNKVPWWQTRSQYCKAHAEELAMKHFDWAINSQDEIDGVMSHQPQAAGCKELRDLYVWWKHIRPTRPDPTEYWANGGYTNEALKQSMAMEAEQEAEDTKMLIRLVQNRGALWT